MNAFRRFDVEPLPGYHPEVGLLLATLQDSTREWRGELQHVDPEVVVWQPYVDGPSVATEILHIAGVESWWLEEAALGVERDPAEVAQRMEDEIQVYKNGWPKPPNEPLDYFLDLHDRVRRRVIERWLDVHDPERHIGKPEWEASLSLRWMLGHVIQHDSYHGGQAVLLSNLYTFRGRSA